ncbi:kinase-like domain-containing protein [Rhizophagus irregularis DAOM 181602=DAOM 197198]|nr:kinase-like domain-containing protein [Rhizophagus irregularis DAOM 181602=DAOM 197198]
MPLIRKELIGIALNRATSLIDFCIHNDINKQVEFMKQIVYNDNSLNKSEIKKAIKILTKDLDYYKVLYKEGEKRICENSDWIDGCFHKWDPKKKELIRSGNIKVILKRLQNVESADRHWFEEAETHSNISSNKRPVIVQCYGLTRDENKYYLVMAKMDTDLRNYLKQNKSLTWKERISIVSNIINSLYIIHNEKAIHRDLHSGNILYSKKIDYWYISDFGFCGPADKPLKTIYGNLPYVAPEVLVGRKYTFASDIYSIAILMWEMSSGRPPFQKYYHNYELAMNIVNGMRPKIVPETPLEYENLMKQCWDADPLKRPDIDTLLIKIREIKKSLYHIIPDELMIGDTKDPEYLSLAQLFKLISQQVDERVYENNSSSKLYDFEGLPEPKNATEEEQEVFHSKPTDFIVPHSLNDIHKSSIAT